MSTPSARSLSSESSQTNAANNNQQRRRHYLKMALILVLGLLSLILLGVIVYSAARIYLSAAQESKQAIYPNEVGGDDDGAIRMRSPSDRVPQPPRLPRIQAPGQQHAAAPNPVIEILRGRSRSPPRQGGRVQQQQQPLQQAPRPREQQAVSPLYSRPRNLWNKELACTNFYKAVCGSKAYRPKSLLHEKTQDWLKIFTQWFQREAANPRAANSRAMRIIANLVSECDTPYVEKLMRSHVLVVFRLALDYTSGHRNPEVQKDIWFASNMIDALRSAFDEILRTHYKKMDDDTRGRMRKKLSRMTPLVGYPAFVLNDKELDWYYETVNEESDILDCNATYWSYTKSYQDQVRKAPDALQKKWAFGISLTASIASYNAALNTIGASLMLLQPPIFDRSYVPVLNYAMLGWTIAHEITHAFDNVGCQYDEEGKRAPLCTPAAQQWFQERADCFAEQYSGHEFPLLRNKDGGKVYSNGSKTQGEDIADNGGIRIAYAAFTKQNDRQDQHQEGKFIYDEDRAHTPAQLFFITYARQFCVDLDKDALEFFSKIKHSLPWLRVNLVLKNFNHFRSAFGCTEGEDAMAPKKEFGKRCKLW